MSLIPLKADIRRREWHVRYVPIADIGGLTYLNWLVADQTDPLRVNQGMRRALLFVLLLTLTLAPAEARRHGHHHGGLWGFLSIPHAHRHGHRRHSEVARRHTRGSVRAAAASDRAQGGTYTTADLVPPDWQLQPTDPNLKGQRFVSADGTASLALFATPAKQEPIAEHMNAIAFVDGEQITHLHGEENWIEVSGSKADHSFYRKAVLACGGRAWHEVDRISDANPSQHK